MENRDYALTDLLNKSVTSGQEVILAANIESLIRRALITPTGVDTFIGLVDVLAPSGYTGQAGLFPVVNSTETGLIFADIGLSGYISVDAVTATALPANTYANGAAGVGATLTASGNGAFPSVDSQTSFFNMLVAVKNFTGANKFKNGVYNLTTLGTGSTAWVLTRATSSDTSAELNNQIVFAAYSKVGTLNGAKYFNQIIPTPTVGTSSVQYEPNRAGGTQGLGQVLTVSDDAATLNIQNVGQLSIGKSTATVPLDVIGDAKIATATYTSGLFLISETQGRAYLGDWNSDLNGTAVECRDDIQRTVIGVTVPAAVPTGTAGLYMGESTGFGYAGFTCDFGNDNKDQGSFIMGRPTGGGTYIQVADGNGQGGVDISFQSSGIFSATMGGGSKGLIVDLSSTGFGGLGIYTFGNADINQGLSMDFTGGTATGIYILGNTAGGYLKVDDGAHNTFIKAVTNIDLTSSTISINSLPTYSGNMAAAVAGNYVIANGHIMAP